MARLNRTFAHDVLQSCKVADPPPDFHTLNSAQVDALLHWSRIVGYRKPKTASGSKARYFYAYVVRAAADRPFSGFVY